jgi:divalent metal cation (Fe/Co/Zn/Cd) transporter
VACLVAANIVWSGVGIVRKSVSGLMDTALPIEDQNKIQKILEPYVQSGIQYHALRTRQSGARQFVSFHVLVPSQWTVERGHQLLEDIETDIHRILPGATVFTHLESLNDPASGDDTETSSNSEITEANTGLLSDISDKII